MKLIINLVFASVSYGQILSPIVFGPHTSASNTFTYVQRVVAASCGTATTCTLTMTIGAGHLLVADVLYSNTVNPVALTSISGGANSFTVDSGTSCLHYDVASTLGTTCGYILSSTSVTTQVFTATMASGPNIGWVFAIEDVSFTGGSVSKDTAGATLDAACTSCAGITLTLAGGDAVFQFANPTNSISAVSSPYTTNASFAGGNGYANSLNTSSGTAPTWTNSPSGTVAVAAIAFKSP